jgi:Na+-translocating ferredoxin:NAD+ oxidoreductase subunit B
MPTPSTPTDPPAVDVYTRLARFLDELPAGYPAAPDGGELRILRKLFTPEQAALFLRLELLPESARVVAFRAGLPLEQAAGMLEEMERRGLIAGEHRPGKAAAYSVNQFVVGFMEEQVDRVDRELAELIEAYLPVYFRRGPWKEMPQVRTVPVGESIPVENHVIPYERAEELVRRHTHFAVRNCVCRQQRAAIGKGCGKPMETCLSFDSAAQTTVFNGRGRSITLDEALAVLKQADRAGLVLQPANSKDPPFICACCGCCCGVLRGLKLHEKPADLVSNAYIAHFDAELCIGCGACVERCQMDALSQSDDLAALEPERCIGCGLCVSTCASGALNLVRKPPAQQPRIPFNTLSTYVQLGRARGKLSVEKIVSLVVKSGVDRLRAPRRT